MPFDDIGAFFAGRINGIFSAAIFFYILASLRWHGLADGISIARPVQFLLAVFFSVITIIGYWYSGQSTASAIGGLIPISDAHGYYDCAQGLLEEKPLNIFCTRRPLYTSMLSGWLFIADKNMQLVILLQSILTGIVAWLVADSVRKVMGWRVALVSFAVMMQFSILHVITTLTENAGILLGGVAAVFILKAAQNRNIGDWIAGIFLLTVAINARAGVYFVIPTVLMFAYFYSHGKERLILLSSGVIAIVIGFSVPWVTLLITGSETGNVNSNFSYTFYGLVAGGKRWTQVFTDHPEIFKMGLGEKDVAKEVYRVSFDLFFAKPWLLVKSYVMGYAHFIDKAFKFYTYLPLRIIAVGAWLTGMWALWGRRDNQVFGMLLLIMVGVLLSAPIIIYDGGYRVFAPATALMAVVAGIGAETLYKIVSTKNLRALTEINSFPTVRIPIAAFLFSIVLVGAIIFSPFLGSKDNKSENFSGLCKKDEVALKTDYSKTASINLTNNGEWRLYPLSIPVNRFRRDMEKWMPHIDMFKALPPNTSIVATNVSYSFSLIFNNIMTPNNRNDVICVKKNSDYPPEFSVYK